MRAIKVLALALLMVAVIISGWFYLALFDNFPNPEIYALI
jgi:hypothetical protein